MFTKQNIIHLFWCNILFQPFQSLRLFDHLSEWVFKSHMLAILSSWPALLKAIVNLFRPAGQPY